MGVELHEKLLLLLNSSNTYLLLRSGLFFIAAHLIQLICLTEINMSPA